MCFFFCLYLCFSTCTKSRYVSMTEEENASALHYELQLADCSVTCGGMAQFIIRVKQESYFLLTNIILRWHLSIVEQAAQKINGLTTAFSHLRPSLSMSHCSHTHMHMHTPLNAISPPITRGSVIMGMLHSYSDGEMMTMAHYPLSLKNGSDTFNACMCLLVNRPVITVRL